MEYIRDNRNLLALLLLMSMMLGVMIYAFMWFLSKDGIEERQQLERAGKYSMVTTYDYEERIQYVGLRKMV